MIDVDGLHGGPEHVGQKHELLTPVSGDVPGRGEEVNGLLPLRLGQSYVTDEPVQVPDQ